MVKVRALRINGDWDIAIIPFVMYLYGKFWLMISDEFRKGANILSLKLIMPWENKYLHKS